jgi:hypothetical protein
LLRRREQRWERNVEYSNRRLQQELCPGKFLMVWFVVYKLYKSYKFWWIWWFLEFHIVSHVPLAIDFSVLLSILSEISRNLTATDDVWASPRTICLQSCSSNWDNNNLDRPK